MKRLKLNSRALRVAAALLDRPFLRREHLFEILEGGVTRLDTTKLWARFSYLRRKLGKAGIEIIVEHGRGIYLTDEAKQKLRSLI